MMDVSRRSFLGGALALGAAVTLPSAAFSSAPIIYGDGIRDDTLGLQAALNGRPFRCEGGSWVARRGSRIEVRDGTFRISSPLTLRSQTVIRDSAFNVSGIRGAEVVFEVPTPVHDITIVNNAFRGSGRGFALLSPQ